jgi:hypothetical protein
MLLDLKHYLQQRPGCTLDELCQQFSTSESVVQSMLERLKVSPTRRGLLQSGCDDGVAGCSACPLKSRCQSKVNG